MHKTEGGLLKPIIFGGLDGILTSFAIVSGSAGGNLSRSVILILGFSNIFADALSMGVGEFLSSKAESEWILSERKREVWEMDNYPEGEIQEMIDIYTRRGMDRGDATKVIEIMSKYKEFFVDIMMAEELELQVPEENYQMESFKEGKPFFASSYLKTSTLFICFSKFCPLLLYRCCHVLLICVLWGTPTYRIRSHTLIYARVERLSI